MRALSGILLILLTALAVGPAAEALTGGRFSVDPVYSAIVKVQPGLLHGELLSCTGTFISPRHILMAAHCMNDPKDSSNSPVDFSYAKFPSDDLFFKAIRVSSANLRFHSFDDYFSHGFTSNPSDLGIVELEFPVAVQPFAVSAIPLKTNDSLFVAGYGCDRKLKTYSTNFKVAEVAVAEVGAVVELKKSSAQLCKGDSGGPAFRPMVGGGFEVVGVNSYMNLFSSALGGTRDRLSRLDSPAVQAWLKKVLATDSFGHTVQN